MKANAVPLLALFERMMRLEVPLFPAASRRHQGMTWVASTRSSGGRRCVKDASSRRTATCSCSTFAELAGEREGR